MSARFFVVALIAMAMAALPAAAADFSRLLQPWPNSDAIAEDRGEDGVFASTTPFVLEHVGAGPELDPPVPVRATLFVPDEASPENKAPAVIMLHGSAGLLDAREFTYGPQYAAMGIAAVAVDSFGSRRHIATGYVDRVLNITETTLVADAYAALRYLATRPEIDARRVAVIGFSYGALSALLAAYEQAAERFAPDGLRFAAHVSYYGPCLARWEDSRATGAPVLLLSASEDRVTDPERCAEVVADLRAGGARVEQVRYERAYHQWDGNVGTPDAPRRRSTNLASCRFRVEADGTVRDVRTWLAMTGVFTRRLILGLCNDSEGYLQARSDAVRALSNADVGKFLARAFADGAPRRPSASP